MDLYSDPMGFTMQVTVKRFETLCDQYKGFCTKCKKITRGECEPDARNYPCPRCKENKVMGVENACLENLILIR